ncbi:hypothetical protein DLJ59_21435 [Micromonospora inaquosa]|uniref:Uncharacterized protein n=1 Tax=Micromonospora inaquosa TaxID=2203716 RepID=A0A3N9WZE9_9ACTN|nr:hypothetical protein DLJ59_21435 [Micromonospora inaquosa]
MVAAVAGRVGVAPVGGPAPERLTGHVCDEVPLPALCRGRDLAVAATGPRSAVAGREHPQLTTRLANLGAGCSGLGVDVESIDEIELDRLQQRRHQLCAS